MFGISLLSRALQSISTYLFGNPNDGSRRGVDLARQIFAAPAFNVA
ncbi:hypothetical protein [Burkholderia multivorans]|nr:hypothetical protein [Burkholderia multivorans]